MTNQTQPISAYTNKQKLSESVKQPLMKHTKGIQTQPLSEDAIDIKDKNGNTVYFGDKFIAKMVEPSYEKGTLVAVVKDLSKENIACDRNYDLEDENGDRLWNAYMVIANGVKVNS